MSCTSETIGWSSVAVDHTARVPRTAARHSSAVIEGLCLAVESVALAAWLLGHWLVASGVGKRLVLRMEGTDHCEHNRFIQTTTIGACVGRDHNIVDERTAMIFSPDWICSGGMSSCSIGGCVWPLKPWL